MASGTRRAVATSAAAQDRNEAAELDRIRGGLARGELTMREAQLQLIEMVLHRTADFPDRIQDEMRERLLEVVDTDPYFQLALDVAAEP